MFKDLFIHLSESQSYRERGRVENGMGRGEKERERGGHPQIQMLIIARISARTESGAKKLT